MAAGGCVVPFDAGGEGEALEAAGGGRACSFSYLLLFSVSHGTAVEPNNTTFLCLVYEDDQEKRPLPGRAFTWHFPLDLVKRWLWSWHVLCTK